METIIIWAKVLRSALREPCGGLHYTQCHQSDGNQSQPCAVWVCIIITWRGHSTQCGKIHWNITRCAREICVSFVRVRIIIRLTIPRNRFYLFSGDGGTMFLRARCTWWRHAREPSNTVGNDSVRRVVIYCIPDSAYFLLVRSEYEMTKCILPYF